MKISTSRLPARPVTVHLQLDFEELEWLGAQANASNVTASRIVRQLIADARQAPESADED